MIESKVRVKTKTKELVPPRLHHTLNIGNN